jgi:hypothetical protein
LRISFDNGNVSTLLEGEHGALRLRSNVIRIRIELLQFGLSICSRSIGSEITSWLSSWIWLIDFFIEFTRLSFERHLEGVIFGMLRE